MYFLLDILSYVYFGTQMLYMVSQVLPGTTAKTASVHAVWRIPVVNIYIYVHEAETKDSFIYQYNQNQVCMCGLK